MIDITNIWKHFKEDNRLVLMLILRKSYHGAEQVARLQDALKLL